MYPVYILYYTPIGLIAVTVKSNAQWCEVEACT